MTCLALAACGPYPRDISGTLDRVEQTRSFAVGLAETTAAERADALAFLDRVERATGAEARIERGPTEALLVRLEQGELDLVIGPFAEGSPWAQPVAIIEPISTRREGTRVLELAAATRNGENRWIALVEREVRDGRAP